MDARAQAVDRVVYVDTSALIRAYLPDETDHDALRARLFDGTEAVVTSEIAIVEITSALRAAGRHRRLENAGGMIDRAMQDMEPGGAVSLLNLDADRVIGRARHLCDRHRLRALDAIHLAVALTDTPVLARSGTVTFVTRDADQAEAARQEGLRVE